MSAVTLEGISKRFGDVQALESVSLAFPEGSFSSLLGPSGSGKTTLLRAVAGFVEPDSGSVRIDGAPVENIPVHRRDIGMVFQNYALFPHMSVFDNVAFGLSVRGTAKAEIGERVRAMLALVRLEGMEDRRSRQLSGGQQQRVALARALVTSPRVLLLDEPLGALDKRLRQEMQIELRQIQRKLGITTILVTHDQEEALTLSDHIAILNEGRLIQAGAPAEIYERPRSVFVSAFLGDSNFLRGEAAGGGQVRTPLGDITTSDDLPVSGEPVVLAIRAEKLSIRPEGPADGAANRLDGVIRQLVYTGASVTYFVDVAGTEFRVFEQNREASFAEAGSAVTLTWAPRHTVVVAE